MEPVELKIKKYLEEERRGRGLGSRESAAHPATEAIYRYVMDELAGEELDAMLAHLKGCPEDQELVKSARRISEADLEAPLIPVPGEAVAKAKALVKDKAVVSCPHCGKPITPFKSPAKTQLFWSALWFSSACLSFALSFIFRGYFLQFLVLAALFGVKGILDQKAVKTQILIYKALKEQDTPDSKDLHETHSRL